MKVLVTGKGNRGSWKIRGEQLGSAIGATVKPMATYSDCESADVIVLVKRFPDELIATIRNSSRPWVLDIVDGWPQPCAWEYEESIIWLKQTLHRLSPSAVVFGTEQMQVDAEFNRQSIVLPHHSWCRYIEHTPSIKQAVAVVGYEGDLRWLGKWAGIVSGLCRRRGWLFQVNGDMTKADIGIALRDGGGYPARHWKPGTKLSNLHALGIPAVCSREAGYESVASGGECWIEKVSASALSDAFDFLDDKNTRLAISQQMRSKVITLGQVAAQYKTWLASIA